MWRSRSRSTRRRPWSDERAARVDGRVARRRRWWCARSLSQRAGELVHGLAAAAPAAAARREVQGRRVAAGEQARDEAAVRLPVAAGVSLAPLVGCVRLPVVAAREPVALVTADTEAHAAVVSLGGAARAAARARRSRARAASRAGGGRAIVGTARPARRRCSRAGRRGCGGSCAAFRSRATASSRPTAGHAFVTDSGHGELAVIDLERGRVVRRVEVGARRAPRDDRTRGPPCGSRSAPRRREIAVVGIGDPRRPRVLRRVRPPFLVHDVGFSPEWQARVGDRRPRAVARGLRRRRPRPAAAARAPTRRRGTSRSARRSPTSRAARAAPSTFTR